ncbi:hypothetical protein R7007_21830 [Vibrio sp. 1636]|uniref:hypothetical protein n=1 Tax=Vibrio TaxID=662 RepID=UPI00146C6F05|nr:MULTISPECIES: hypothetical protein [Vibrio]MDW2204313.1 hypothetical protein [Vibrio sp. 1636]
MIGEIIAIHIGKLTRRLAFQWALDDGGARHDGDSRLRVGVEPDAVSLLTGAPLFVLGLGTQRPWFRSILG